MTSALGMAVAGVSPLKIVRSRRTVLTVKEIGSTTMVRGRDVVATELDSGTT